VFTGVSLVSTRDAEGPGCCRSGLCAPEKIDGVGDKRAKNTTTVVTETVLESFLEDFQTWDCLPLLLMYQGFQYQHPGYRSFTVYQRKNVKLQWLQDLNH
jgi:hypothetical protein